MKNLFLLFSVLLFSATTSQSQELNINWGESFDSSTEVETIIGISNNTMVAYSSKGKKNYIETYDVEKGYIQLNSSEYEVPEVAGQQTGLLNITLRGDKVFALIYGYEKKTKSFAIYSQYLSLEGSPIGVLDEIYTSSAVDAKIKDQIVDVRFSPNKKYALMFFDRTNKERTNFFSDVVIMNLKDAEAPIQTQKYDFAMRSGSSEDVNYKMYHSIDNNGSYFFMTQRVELTKRVISDFTLGVQGYHNDGSEIGTTVIKDDERVLLSPTIVTDNDKYIVVGYYMSNPKKRANISGYAGLFTARLDSQLSVEKLTIEEFSDDFFLDLYSEGKIARMNKKDKEIQVPAPYTMDYIIPHSDGTLTVLSEFYLVTVQQDKGARTTTTQYGNIIYYKIGADGKIMASDVIKKLQMSATSSIGIGLAGGSLSMFMSYETKDKRKKYWSYALSTDEDNVYLVFNDNLKNADDDEDDLSRALSIPSKGVPFLATISNDGSFTKEAMSDSQDSDTYCVPQVIYHLDESNFIIWGVRRKENKFGEATIK